MGRPPGCMPVGRGDERELTTIRSPEDKRAARSRAYVGTGKRAAAPSTYDRVPILERARRRASVLIVV